VVQVGLVVLICFVGLVAFLVAKNPKVEQAGRLAYMIALAALLWCWCGSDVVVRLLQRK